MVAVEVFGPVEAVDPVPWIAVTAALSVAWTALLVQLSRVGLRRMRLRREALAIARRHGGHGPPGLGGHQPVGPLLVERKVIVGRVTPSAVDRMGRVFDRHSKSGDPRLRFSAPRRRG